MQIAPDAVYFLESCQNLCFLWPNTAIYNACNAVYVLGAFTTWGKNMMDII